MPTMFNKSKKGFRLRMLSPVTFIGSLVVSISLFIFLLMTEQSLHRATVDGHLRLAGQSLRTVDSVVKETLLQLEIELQRVAASAALLRRKEEWRREDIEAALVQLYNQDVGTLFDILYVSDLEGNVLADAGLTTAADSHVADQLTPLPEHVQSRWQLLNFIDRHGETSSIVFYSAVLGKSAMLYAGLRLNGHDMLFTQIERRSGAQCAVLLKGDAVLAKSSLSDRCQGAAGYFKSLFRWQRASLNNGLLVIRGSFPSVVEREDIDVGLIFPETIFPTEIRALFDHSLAWLAGLIFLNLMLSVFFYWATSVAVRQVLEYAGRLSVRDATPPPHISIFELDQISRSLGAMSAAFEREMLTREEAESRLVNQERMSTLGEISAIIAHELRNPLSTVSNSLSLLSKLQLCDDNAQGVRALTRASFNVERCNDIITDLFNYSRAGARQLECLDLALSLQPVVAEVCENFDVTVEWDIAPELYVQMQFGKLQVVISNLLHNSIQAFADADLSKEFELRLDATLEEQWCNLSIKDNGPGMDEKIMARALEPLFSTKQYGVGLGLSIVQKVMKEFDGEFILKSENGQGTVATLRFRRCEANAEMLCEKKIGVLV